MHWNQKLVNCLMAGVPVGVFLQQNSSSSSYLRFLAFVEEFNPENTDNGNRAIDEGYRRKCA